MNEATSYVNHGLLWSILLGAGLSLRPPLQAQELPAMAASERPPILLQLGRSPEAPDRSCLAVHGEVVDHTGDRGIQLAAREVTSLRGSNGIWATSFRFALPPGHPAGAYTFWAHWKQGGDPRTSVQTFEVWAGPSATSLVKRAASALTPGGWTYVWRAGATVAIAPGDAVVEVRNRGNGQTAKTFDAFLLGHPKPPPEPVALPAAGTADHPVVALGFGAAPLWHAANDAAVVVLAGTVAAKSTNVLYASVGGDTATVAHKGFGEWGATFRFVRSEGDVPPGFYTFHARYMSGGEPSQARQTFTLLAGPDVDHLGVRGTFQTANNTPFKQQWVAGRGVAAVFPGDHVLQVVNAGKAHDVKVFEGFALAFDSPMPAWMTAERAQLRSRLLAAVKPLAQATRTLYVVDGDGHDAMLFDGLARSVTQAEGASTRVIHLLGPPADAMARDLHLSVLPAAVMVNEDRRVLGVFADPADAGQVATFLAAPATAGVIPAYPEEPAAPATALLNGVPAQWLVASGWPGRSGVGHWGLDAEALQRPNPGDVYAYGFYTAGNRSGRWTPRSTGTNGVCIITEALAESYAWGRGTSYAVVYLDAARAVAVSLHLQHSGEASAAYLDGVEQALQADPAPVVRLGRQATAVGTQVVDRVGQETHDDISLPQSAQPAQCTTLSLAPGTHCLVLKLVHAQGKGEAVLFAAAFTGADAAAIRTQVGDPAVAPAVARAAAGLWPSLTLEGVPGNLPRPGEPLTLVADMRVLPSFVGKQSPEAFLPIDATLRVTMRDYAGKPVRAWETRGVFPAVAKLDLGPAPVAGYYALTPELVAADGRLIHRFHPDGFSVVRGNTAQRARVDRKELWNSWYYAFNDWDTFAPWLERLGLFKNVGSIPGTTPEAGARWKDAQARGIVLVGDFAGDSAWMNNATNTAQAVVALAPAYTRYFKTVNEIDGRWNGAEAAAWDAVRTPTQWVARARWHYEALHKARPDAVYFGGSLYCSGVERAGTPPILGPRAWFRRCLELGLDQYVDAWDVHAYPQFPPKLEAPSVSNSPHETDLGILEVMKELGKANTKPFLLGETGAMVWHGFAGMRWQAATVAKLAAWTNSREDWLGVAFCAAHHNRRVTMEEYGMAHNPGEAALYTAGALIDGLPYKRVPAEDPAIQAATFGDTFMAWRADDRESEWSLSPAGDGPWVLVDVVGNAAPLERHDGVLRIPLGTSPVYALSRERYEALTR